MTNLSLSPDNRGLQFLVNRLPLLQKRLLSVWIPWNRKKGTSRSHHLFYCWEELQGNSMLFFFVLSWKNLGGSKDRRKHALNMISVIWKFRSGSALNRYLKRLFSFLQWGNFFHYGDDNFILYAPVYLTAWGCFEDTWHFWGQLLQFKFSVLQLQQLFWSFGWRKKWHLEISVRIWNEQEKKNANLAAVSSGLTELKTWRKMWEEIISQSSPGSFQDIIVDAYDRMSCMHLTFRLISRTVYWNIRQCQHITQYSLLKPVLVELTDKRKC